MGARLSIDYGTHTPSPEFLASEAAQVTIDELGDYDGPDGLEQLLEGCASDEKERMRTFGGREKNSTRQLSRLCSFPSVC